MVKSSFRKEECEISTSLSICVDSEDPLPETLRHIIEQLPKLTHAQRRTAPRMPHSPKNTSRKWSHPETHSFYRLLQHFGLDFTLISYHPTFLGRRSQKELSNKYKKETRRNPITIDRILNRIDEQGLFHHALPAPIPSAR